MTTTAVLVAQSVTNVFDVVADQITRHIADVGDPNGVMQSIVDDIDRTATAMLDMVMDSPRSPHLWLHVLMDRELQLGERVAFRLSCLLQDSDTDTDPNSTRLLRLAHANTIGALSSVLAYLTIGETEGDGDDAIIA